MSLQGQTCVGTPLDARVGCAARISMRTVIPLLLISLAASLGCTSTPRRGRRGADSGITTTTDGSTARDTGGIVHMDSGTSRDTGVAPPRDAGGACAEDIIARYGGVACSAATSSCTAACPDGACIGRCLDADSNPDCRGCANQNIVSCFNSNGCQAQWNCFQCATAFDCSSATVPRDCITANCGPQDDAYDSCTAAITSGDCGTAWSTCVP